MNRTIDQINDTIWYRLTKVLFVLGFLSAIAIGNGIVFTEVGIKNINAESSTLICNVPLDTQNEYSLFEAASHLDVGYFRENEFDYKRFMNSYFNEYKVRNILETCFQQEIGLLNITSLQKEFELRSSLSNASNFELLTAPTSEFEITEEALAEAPDWNYEMFSINPVFSYKEFLISFILTNFFIIFGFEIVRRIFYYIILGTLVPKRNKTYESRNSS